MDTRVKTCTKCNETKELSGFYQRKKSSGKILFRSKCKACESAEALAYRLSNPEKMKANRAAWGERHPEQLAQGKRSWAQANIDRTRTHWRKKLLKKYGLSLQDYDQMFEAQDGKCKICDLPSQQNLYVDHNHDTGHVRGLLCNKCNSLIGYALESEKILLGAIEYLASTNSLKKAQ